MKPSERLKKQIEKEGIKAYESKTYTPKKQKKAAERSAPSLRSQGQSVEVVKDTGMGTALSNLRDRANKPTVRINTDKGFTAQNTTVNPVIGWKPADMTKSTAKDEKTRLYETNDSLLNSDEIIKKYQYVAQDKDMDDETLQRAVKKGMSEVRRTLRGTNDMSRYETVAKLQTELQGRLKSASFMAGFLNSMGGDVAKITAKATGNEHLQNAWGKTLNQLEETQEANRGAGMAGAMTGELAKAGAGYMTIGKAAEKAALTGAEKMLGGKALSKGGEIATRLIGQQAADTAVNTPITIAAGLAEGKEKDDIARDIGKQMALDAAFNVGLEGIGQISKVAGKALNKTKAENEIKGAADAQRDSTLIGSPPSSGKQPTASIDSVPETTENVKETVDASKISDVADAMVQKRNVLAKRMTKEERQALELEYANLQNSEYKMAQLKKIREETGGDERAVLAASNKFDARMKEIESELAAQEVLRTDVGIQMDAADEIGKIFGLTKEKEKKSINNIIQNAVKYANGGAISQKERERLFQKFYQKSRKTSVDTKKLADELRYKKILLGVDAAADIADINEWNKQLKGILGYIKAGRESNVEEIYAALHKQYPTYFPESVDDPAKQLQQMRKVAEDIAAGKELSEADIRENFNKALDRLEEAMNVKAAYREAAAENIDGYRSNLLGRTDYGMVDAGEVQSWHNEAYRLQQAADRITTELNKTEAFALESLLNGDAAEDAIKNIPGVNAEKVMEHYNVQKPLRELQEKINGHKSFVHAQRYNYIAKAVGEIHIGDGKKGVWRDKKTGFQYGRETLERNIRDIAPDEEIAERVNQAVAQPIHEAERLRQLFIREYKDKLKPLKISTKKNIKIDLPEFGGKKVSESALVQWLGEHEYDLKQAMDAGVPKESYAELEASIRSVRNALTADQQNRVNAGIEALREIYKEVHPMINEVLIRNGYDPIGYIDGYFPHMNFDDPSSGFEKAASLLGYDLASKELPMDIAGRTEDFRPGKKWFGNSLKREGTKTDYDALRAFDQYIDGIGDVIYHTDNIQNLRAMDDYFRYSFSSDAVKAKVDAVKATDQDFLEKQSEIAKIYEENSQNHKLQNFVTYLDTFTNLLAGKKHDLDRGLEKHLLGRQVYKYANEIENKVAGNMVAGNIASAMTNFIPITQAIGSVGMKNGLSGMIEALAYLGRRGKMDELTKKSAFLTTRTSPDMLYSTLSRKVSDVIGTPMEIADTFTTQAVWRGRYYDNIGKGMSETNAIRNADEYCRGLFGGRSKGSMPTFLQSKAWKPFTMFQLEVNNQVSYLLKDIPREKQGDVKKIFGAWAGMAIGAYVFNDFYEALTGRRSALDPFGIANEAIGDVTGTRARNIVDILGDVVGDVREDVEKGRNIQISMPKLTEKAKEKNTAQTLAGLTKNIGGNVPFVGGLFFDGGRIPLQSAIPGLENTMNAAGNLIDGGELEAPGKATLLQEAVKPAFYLLPTAGGGQMLKTAKGLNTMVKGGKYSQSRDGEKLQFAVDQDKNSEWFKALLFGQWATEGGKDYIEDSSQMLSANQTETYKKMVEAGAKNTVAFETISRIEAKEKNSEKRNAIRSSLMSDEQKAILYYDLVANDEDKKVMDLFQGSSNQWNIADCLSRMAEYRNDTPKRSVLRNSEMSENEKKYIYLNKIVQEKDREKETGRVTALLQSGLRMNDFLNIKNKFGQLYNDKTMKNDSKQIAMVQWMQDQGYSATQMQTVRENFAFSSGFTVKWKY